jgi:hypothetical protein
MSKSGINASVELEERVGTTIISAGNLKLAE